MGESFDAFIKQDWEIAPTGQGSLDGTVFSVKDIYHIAGHRASFGNPDWYKTHEAFAENSPSIEKLLAAGASAKGVTHTVEMAFSLIGFNPHYGTPINPNAVNRDPGGSSSGSAAAVAGELADFALGSDTSGSVRIPASHCGIYGLRPTHNRIPLEGILPLAPGFDTIGWFARDPKLLRKVGQVLFSEWKNPESGVRFLAPREIWDQASVDVQNALKPKLEILAEIFGDIEEVELTSNGETITDWFNGNRMAQGYEIWQTHQDWVEKENPTFSEGVGQRMDWSRSITKAEFDEGQALRGRISAMLENLLADGTVLVFPSSHDVAPLRDLETEAMEQYRYDSLRMTCLSGMTGTPQITLPLAKVDGAPIGLSFLAKRGGDEKLLALAEAIGGEAKNGLASIVL